MSLILFKKVFIEYCFCFIFYFFGHEAHGLLAPQPGIEPVSPCIGRQILNPWTTREAPKLLIIASNLNLLVCMQILSHFI